ncbi:hypothetical protein [Aestuariibacter salexigens]|uniref:hypothetical protein n=1 Tax=Aestuariibacter salexigens TaxID=226010 RepID=UPI000416D626|nr:hypothetical protein [Aestuariibacter salexigens]
MRAVKHGASASVGAIACILAPLMLLGCSTSPTLVHQQDNPSIAVKADLPPISFFTSYLTDEQQQQCDAVRAEHSEQACLEDPVDPTLLLQALENAGRFNKVALSADGFDYELLVSSKATRNQSLASSLQNLLHTLSLGTIAAPPANFDAQVSVTWRGIELGNVQYQTQLELDNPSQQAALAAQFSEHIVDALTTNDVFSAEHLYATLQASDYHHEMQLPNNIDEFQMYDMQLFRDPFQGAMVRYWHPLYAEENIDVFVYPVAQQDLTNQEGLLLNELEREKRDITLLAEARNIGELNISDVQPIQWQTEDKKFSGFYQGVDASQDSGTLYASTYLFLLEDKFVKVSANFPPRIATQLVKQAIPQIKVPSESKLMAQLRGG